MNDRRPVSGGFAEGAGVEPAVQIIAAHAAFPSKVRAEASPRTNKLAYDFKQPSRLPQISNESST